MQEIISAIGSPITDLFDKSYIIAIKPRVAIMIAAISRKMLKSNKLKGFWYTIYLHVIPLVVIT
jgi:hypothetical protein